MLHSYLLSLRLVLDALQLPLHVMEHVALLPLVSQTHP
jgi:hypothetical protein